MTIHTGNITIEQTIMPPDKARGDEELDRQHALERLRDRMAKYGAPTLTWPDGGSMRLGEEFPELSQMLEYAATALAGGIPVRYDAKRTTLVSTSQAADILGVSRPTMVRFLNENRLPYTMPGKHRRLELADVLEFKEKITHRQHEAAGDIQEITDAVFDDPGDGPQ